MKVNVKITLGEEDRLSKLYSHPNSPNDGLTLTDTIEHWFNQTLERDGFATQGAKAKVVSENSLYYLVIEGPDGIDGYQTCLPEFLNHGWEAYTVMENIKSLEGTWPDGLSVPTLNRVWDPQQTKQWRFFLPHGMAMLRQNALNFFHYPPIRLLDTMRDYLNDPVPVRLIEMMKANGVQSDEQAWLLSTVMDGAPIAAPDDQGTQYIQGLPPVHLIPIDHFHAYQKAMVKLLLRSPQKCDTLTFPIVVYGSPARSSFEALYPGVKLSTSRVSSVEIIPGKTTAVLASGHPYRFYAQAQVDEVSGSEVGSGGIVAGKFNEAFETMKKDLAVIRWQCRLAEDPTQKPQAVFEEAVAYWAQDEQKAALCRLVLHQGSLWYPSPEALAFTFKVSLDQADQECQNQDPQHVDER